MIKLEKIINQNDDIFNKLKYDKEVMKNVSSIITMHGKMYYIKNEEEIIGLLRIHSEYGDNFSIDIAILDKYTNMHFGTEALIQVDEIIKDKKWNKLILRTNYDNIKAINAALNANYTPDYMEEERCMNEGVSYKVFSKINK